MMRKTGLGKGLDALLPNEDDLLQEGGKTVFGVDINLPRSAKNGEVSASAFPAPSIPAASGGVVMLSPDKLLSNPGQPRKNFDEAEMKELADSIAGHGIIQPIIVADSGDGAYIIIAGERRTRAARLAGLGEVPVIIRNYTDQKRMEISLIENIQRTDLNPIEEATAYKNLMDFSRLSQDEVAARVGKNRSTVANALRLLKLPGDMQKSIEEGAISPGHARAILSVTAPGNREKLYKEILGGGLSVREAEKSAAALNSDSAAVAGAETGAEAPDGDKNGAKEKPAGRAPELGAMEEKFIGRLGTKVVIEGDLNKGRIHIEYYSMEDLERLYEIFGG
ncbi:MAG: ParB/RepB/Spo0J family partition protein [Treponema sp.]|jgi:ParB family chromosome partitioning protein|nr:ParB/RepB/Spo0J family partition protein [Treponema sp.]